MKAHNAKDITGLRFGRLVAIERRIGGIGKNKKAIWLCKCDCGKEKEVYLSNLTRGLTVSCGCYQKEATSKANAGENNKQWRGGTSNARDKIKDELRKWRVKVFEKDNYTCQKCKKRGDELHPHHIMSFANNPDLRLIPENGITLCKKCHFVFHKIYGQQNNDEKQIAEFLV